MQGILSSASAILKRIDLDGKAAEAIVFAAWRQCAAGALAEHIVPTRLEKGRLIAAVSTETWRRNVADLWPELAARINTVLGSPVVRFIEFEIDAAVVRDHRKRLKVASGKGSTRGPDAFEIAPSLAASAEAIADVELRKIFLAAAAGSLARSETEGAEGTDRPIDI